MSSPRPYCQQPTSCVAKKRGACPVCQSDSLKAQRSPKKPAQPYVDKLGRLVGASLEERLKFYSHDGPNGCRIWHASRLPFGYGLISHRSGKGNSTRAHRVAWEIKHGPIPAGMEVCHKCDVPACINVDHLFLGTHAQNMADMALKGRSHKGPKLRNQGGCHV